MELTRHVCKICGADIGSEYAESNSGVVKCHYCGNN